jgi:hypothetical protein
MTKSSIKYDMGCNWSDLLEITQHESQTPPELNKKAGKTCQPDEFQCFKTQTAFWPAQALGGLL